MSKDYAQFYVAPSPQHLRRRRWMFMSLIAFLLLCVACMAYTWMRNHAVPVRADSLAPKKVVPLPAKAPKDPVQEPLPKFDFYTLLPQESVEQESDVTQVEEPRVSLSDSYALQLASFRKKEDAERWSVRLDLLGLEAHIRSVRSQGEGWYRVLLGPYANKAEALQIQKRLRQKHIDSILVTPRHRR